MLGDELRPDVMLDVRKIVLEPPAWLGQVPRPRRQQIKDRPRLLRNPNTRAAYRGRVEKFLIRDEFQRPVGFPERQINFMYVMFWQCVEQNPDAY
jgi:hypothetical protein